jgi:hypothetical protein
MKQILFLLLVLCFGAMLNQNSWAAPPSVQTDVDGQFGFFYASLSPHGEWIEVESGLRVWRPFNVPHQWRPYLLGRWVWTDYGWYWMSDEPFGWITYHYGRWYYDDYYGWVWMPDDVWGPAWVDWRYDDNYIGWAPLPPYATFSVTVGLRFTTPWVAPVHYWNFVRYRRFGAVIRYRDTAPEEFTRRLISTTRSGLHYGMDHDRIINRGIDRSVIEQRGNLRFSRIDVRDVREQSGERMIRSENSRRIDRIEIYRPSQDEMQRHSDRIDVRRGDRALSIDMNKIERPRNDSRLHLDERLQHDRMIQRDAQQQREQELQREEPRRENKPQIQEQEKRDRKEMRHELLQRYSERRRSVPPANREAQQQRIERRKENTQHEHPNRLPSERRSSRNEEKNNQR